MRFRLLMAARHLPGVEVATADCQGEAEFV